VHNKQFEKKVMMRAAESKIEQVDLIDTRRDGRAKRKQQVARGK
jgi:hypothetical protein